MADSSYIVEALLSGDPTLGSDRIIAPSLVVYEVANAIFVRERILHLSGAGERYVRSLFGAIEASLIELVDPSESLMMEAYEIALRNRAATYDCVSVALCLRSGLALETCNPAQMKVLERERTRLSGPSAGSQGA